MKPMELTYGSESFNEIKAFLANNNMEGYTLSIYNIQEESTMEIHCKHDEMIDVISLVSSAEHDFPSWIGINEVSSSYVIGLRFTRGTFHTPSVCDYNNGRLTEIQRW